MSQFYDLASLVVIPSGYKASTIYAQKPLTTDGQLSFTRASGATRVGPNGLIEEVRTNFARQSQSFATASAWATTNGTLTNNAGTAPDGTNTASKLVATNTDPFAYQSITLTGPVVASCYFKGVGSSIGKNSELRIGAAVTTFTLTANWQRVSVTSTVAGAANYGVEAPNASVVVGDEVLLWGFQVEQGDVATDYIPTTTAAVSVGPVSNVPRLDYTNSSCPRLLLEPQRTNLATFSESFNNAAWLKLSATVTANTSVSPDGYASADTLTVSAGGYLYFQVVSYSAVSGQSVTLSLFAKNQINNFLVIGGATTSGTDVYIIENYGNGWYRHILTRTFTATASTTLQYIVATVGTHIIWGAQIEAGSYATSYIPTLGASVTRVADAASKTGISSLIGQTEGTIFIDFVWNNSLGDVVPFDITGSDGKLIWMRGIGAQFYGNGSTLLADIGRPGAVQGTRYKIAFVYGQNDFRLYRNGSLIGTDTSGTFTGTFSDIALNSVINQANAFNQILLFKTKLTNAQLAELTTL